MDINTLEQLASEFGRLHRQLVRVFDDRLKEQGASFSRTKMLLYLDKYGARRAADMADDFGQAPRTVTQAIDGLERQGLVERYPDASDRRVKQVSLTAAGQRAVAAIEPLRRHLIQQVFGALTQDEQRRLAVIFGKLTAAMDAEERR